MSDTAALVTAQRAARTRRDAGDPEGARRALAEALEAARPTYGEDHPDVLLTAYQLAGLHRAAGDAAAARRVLETVLAAGQRRFGDADPLVLMISYELGSVAEELGNRHEARRNFGRVAASGPAVFGPDHWAVRAARTYLDTGVPPGAADGVPSGAVAYPPRSTPPPDGPPLASTPVLARPAPIGVQPRAPGLPGQAPGLPEPAPRWVRAGGSPRRGRGVTITALVAAVAAVVAAVLAAVAVLREPPDGADPGAGLADTSTATAGTGGAPPTDVRVVQEEAEVIVTWRDPANGRASFAVMGAPPGVTPRLLSQVPAGTTRLPVQGLNTLAGYCVRVVALYSAEQVGTSAEACLPATSPGGR